MKLFSHMAVLLLVFRGTSILFFGEGNGNPLQYSCLENPVDRGAWWAAVHGVTQSWTWLKRLNMHACIGEGNGNPLQYSCLENARDRGAWWAAISEVTQNWTWLKRLSSSSSHTIFPLGLYQFYIPSNSVIEFLFPTSSATFDVCGLLLTSSF